MKEGVKIAGIIAVIVLVYHYFFRSIVPTSSEASGSGNSKHDMLSEIETALDPDLGQDVADTYVEKYPLGSTSTEVATSHSEGQDNQMQIASRNSVSILG